MTDKEQTDDFAAQLQEAISAEEPKEALTKQQTDDIVTDILTGSDISESWSEEEKAKVLELLETLEKTPEPPKTDLRDKFKAGEVIRDPQGVRIAIRSVGQESMCVEMIGKRGRFVNGYTINISGLTFVTKMSKGRSTVFELLGPALPIDGPINMQGVPANV